MFSRLFSRMSVLHQIVILPSTVIAVPARQVRFCDSETVRKEYFTEETVPHDFRS
jgi:hypothetical protein